MDGYILKMLMSKSPEFREKFKGLLESEESHIDHKERHHYGDSFPFDKEDYSYNRLRREHSEDKEDLELRRMFDDMTKHEKKALWSFLMDNQESDQSKHITPSQAKYEVEEMCHTEGGVKHKGEKYSMNKAEEVCKKYKSILPAEVTTADVYVAINCHYHNYSQLYKAWFGENIDTKIIESAIVFWFKDENFEGNEKLWKFLNKMK